MRIDKIRIKNFRGIEDLTLELNSRFNLLIGENGSGKTAILTAMAVAMGAILNELAGVDTRHIRDEDIRYFKNPEGSFSYAPMTSVEVLQGFALSGGLTWKRQRKGISGRSTLGPRSEMKTLSHRLNEEIGNSRRVNLIDLPVLAYYSTARLWKEGGRGLDETSEETDQLQIPTRFRGYRDALEIRSTFKFLLDWFKGKYLDLATQQANSFQLECVRSAIISNIAGVVDLKWVFDRDRIQTLYVVFENGEETPFAYLSDGYRNLLAIFADLAWRCVTLNPHFGAEAHLRSEGVVLIDELDLHLHPAWQKEIVQRLKATFPRLQFMASSHSPFLIQEMEDGEVLQIDASGDSLRRLAGTNRLGLEDIAEEIQGVDSPYMSSKREEMFRAAERYFQLLGGDAIARDPLELQRLKDELDSIAEKYSDDVAYYAFLKQERMARGL